MQEGCFLLIWDKTLFYAAYVHHTIPRISTNQDYQHHHAKYMPSRKIKNSVNTPATVHNPNLPLKKEHPETSLKVPPLWIPADSWGPNFIAINCEMVPRPSLYIYIIQSSRWYKTKNLPNQGLTKKAVYKVQAPTCLGKRFWIFASFFQPRLNILEQPWTL